jgi:hypothetical protein
MASTAAAAAASSLVAAEVGGDELELDELDPPATTARITEAAEAADAPEE